LNFLVPDRNPDLAFHIVSHFFKFKSKGRQVNPFEQARPKLIMNPECCAPYVVGDFIFALFLNHNKCFCTSLNATNPKKSARETQKNAKTYMDLYALSAKISVHQYQP
jgi:hypothetical protein